MDDTDKKIGPRLPLLFKMHEIWSAESQKNCCHQMSDFKAKMHQIRFRLREQKVFIFQLIQILS